jgi:hypothetical protein
MTGLVNESQTNHVVMAGLTRDAWPTRTRAVNAACSLDVCGMKLDDRDIKLFQELSSIPGASIPS